MKNTLPCRFDSIFSVSGVCFLFSVGMSLVRNVSLTFTVIPLAIRNFFSLIFLPILISMFSQLLSDLDDSCLDEGSESHLTIKFTTMRESSIALTMQTS
ncbi:hypothetical protein ACO0KY_13415 [Undibacterium sp. Dicai25W]|uniref:hypothetical protein n=1 Tax=Undibacterium sp. Dicai25W TaxID=3413034 RepID=UPI003BF43FA6